MLGGLRIRSLKDFFNILQSDVINNVVTVKPVLRDHCHERPPVLKDHTFLAEGPTFQYN